MPTLALRSFWPGLSPVLTRTKVKPIIGTAWTSIQLKVFTHSEDSPTLHQAAPKLKDGPEPRSLFGSLPRIQNRPPPERQVSPPWWSPGAEAHRRADRPEPE